jgi:integrase
MEIGGLRWSEVNLDKAEIVLAKERVKNKRTHVVPLSGPALAILQAQPRRDGCDLVFGYGKKGFSSWAHAKERLDRAIAENGKPISAWTIHDLRRTAVTGMAEIGVEPHIIEAVVNHQGGHKGGIAGIYNHAKYEIPKARALQQWATHLMDIVENRASKKIVPLRTA